MVYSKTREHVYKIPLAELWAPVKKLISDEGYRVHDAPDSTNTLLSTWKAIGSVNHRYFAKGTAVSPTESRMVIIHEVTFARTLVESTEERDVALEWELLKRVDPQAARRVEAEARGS